VEGLERLIDHAGLSVVLDEDVPLPPEAPVEAIEMVGPPRPGLPGVEPFCEVPAGELAAVASAGAKAKLRCGGARVPCVEKVAAFFAAARDLELAARELFVSMGSCSFSEPVEELRALGVL